MTDTDHVFANLVLEAIRECGSDMKAVERYVFDKRKAKDPVEQEQISREIQLLVAALPPGFREDDPH